LDDVEETDTAGQHNARWRYHTTAMLDHDVDGLVAHGPQRRRLGPDTVHP
jgi:hypothetical protein